MVAHARPELAQQKYTLSEIARKARCSTEALRQRIATGKLVAERGVGGKYLVRADEARRHGWLDDNEGPGHEVLTSAPRRDEAVRRLQMLHAETQRLCAEMGKIIAELEN